MTSEGARSVEKMTWRFALFGDGGVSTMVGRDGGGMITNSQ